MGRQDLLEIAQESSIEVDCVGEVVIPAVREKNDWLFSIGNSVQQRIARLRRSACAIPVKPYKPAFHRYSRQWIRTGRTDSRHLLLRLIRQTAWRYLSNRDFKLPRCESLTPSGRLRWFPAANEPSMN